MIPVRVLQANPSVLRAELERVGAESLPEQLARAILRVVKLENASLALARLLYQELTMEGGTVITSARLAHVGEGGTDVLLCATRYQFERLSTRLRWQNDDELDLLVDALDRALDRYDSHPPALALGEQLFAWGTRTYIMGILNLTPDSFSQDGLIRQGEAEADTVARVLARAHELVEAGADILDVGGESTRPGAEEIDPEIEKARVLPALRILTRDLNTPIAIDTRHAPVADAALEAGAQLVNDVTGLRGDPDMKRVVRAQDAAVVLMHNWLQGTRSQTPPGDVLGGIIQDLASQVELAVDAGIRADSIMIDPGLGFGKTTQENLKLLNRLGEFKRLGRPILIGPSRKGFISKATDVPEDAREQGTAAAIALGIARGADMVRVHDVRAMARVARMADAITRD